MRNFEYLEPDTVGEACEMLRRCGGDAKAYAGGAYLSILMKQGFLQPKALVNLKKITRLKGVREDPREGLILGALVTHREIETSELVKAKLPVLSALEQEVANIRVRNVGTVGGNLASGEPLTDLAQVFIALEARVKISGPGGARIIPVEELFVDYYQTSLKEDELLTEVVIPPLSERSSIEYMRFSSSSAVDKPCVGVAVKVSLDESRKIFTGVRIVLGCVGPTPIRALEAERVLEGAEPDDEITQSAANAAARACKPVGDLRGSEEYKRAMVGVLVARAVTRAFHRAAA